VQRRGDDPLARRAFANEKARDLGLRLGASIWEFWLMRGHITEGRQWLGLLLDATQGTISEARGAATQGAGYLAWIQSESDRALLALRAPGRPARVLPHPVVRTSATVSREEARARVGVAGDGPLVLFLGLVRRYKGVDLLLDAAPEIVRRTGARLAIVGEVFPDARDTMKRVASSKLAQPFLDPKIVFYLARVNKADLELLANLAREGKLKSVIDRRYPLEEIGAALAYLGEGHARGKVVVTVN